MKIRSNTKIIELVPDENIFLTDKDINTKWYEKNNYIHKDSYGGEDTLLILPCNSGASVGNYFSAGKFPHYSNNWRKADKWLRNLRNDIMFTVHSSVEFYFPDGNGAFVFEFENYRVCSDDDKGVPFMKEFVYGNSEDGFSIDKMVEDLKVGIRRSLDYGVKRFVAVETPLAYKTSLFRAVNEMGLWDIFTIIDSRIGTMDLNLKLVNVLLVNNITGYLYHDIYSYKFSEQMKLKTPKKYRFDLSDQYKNITDLGIIFKNICGKTFNHIYPLLETDLELSFTELVNKYKFPYETPLYYVS